MFERLSVHKFDNKITIVTMGDEHIGSKFYNQNKHTEHLDWCLKHNIPIIHMGDCMETATRNSVGAGVFEQEKVVQEQLDTAIALYKPLAKKGLILGMHIGNHEERVLNHSGTNITKILCKVLGVPYLSVGRVHYFQVGKQSYTLYTTHGHSNAILKHTKILACRRLAEMVEADCYCMGHTHSLDHQTTNFYAVDKRKRVVYEKQKHYILTGSYLSHWGSYAHSKAYPPSIIGSPKIKLHSERRLIRVSLG